MHVVTEGPVVRDLTGTLHPQTLVLPGVRIGGPEERGDRETPRAALLEGGESGPNLVVEWSFDVAGDDRVPFRRRAAHARRRYG